ncbi:uncharacterized protein At4g22758 [Brassica rapa]|uniref:DUF7054 domain-containing protein n=2 Tax=Brassica TaxID=3705 RepID=A0A3P6B0N8_BRACM|nr:uncharacterized protein At4g22758 [Brassica rapa]XP_013647628.2 uncharacterized protein At4g22758 [Brassica napus]KAH0918480.1 hypothetical protein HID58_026140 [Brassica napus]CAF2164684.1 unnamed protein product [Brassica napus]CAG7902387.1 unnamed protein product [Brassica rapa]VDC98502.1 unnamed protein product [Brassica rapa]
MPVNSKTANRKGTTGETEKNRRGKLQEKAMSFHGRGTVPHSNPGELRRPKTLPELFSSGRTVVEPVSSKPPRLTKLLLNVTVQGSLGALQIIISPESTVDDLIDAAIRLYVKEARRPFLPESEPARFDLHYSQFSLESIGREQKLISLGSRNFFLCGRKENGGLVGSGTSESCSKEAEKVAAKTGFHWLKFMGF